MTTASTILASWQADNSDTKLCRAVRCILRVTYTQMRYCVLAVNPQALEQAKAACAARGLALVDDDGLLDEVAELPLRAQAKLLKFLDSMRFRRLGGTREISVSLPFKPRPWQRPLIHDPAPRIVAVVHRRAGKSTALVWRGIKRALTNPSA